jgi:Mrp family chromosome partitioning ATPase
VVSKRPKLPAFALPPSASVTEPLADEPSSRPTLADFRAVLRRRAWIVLPAIVLIPLVALLVSVLRDRPQSATVDVELLRGPSTEAEGSTRIFDALSLTRSATTQAEIAGSDEVIFRARRAIANRSGRPVDYSGAVDVESDPASDLLEVEATDDDGEHAVALANEVARQYIGYRRQLDAEPLAARAAEIAQRADRMRAQGDTGQRYRDLRREERELRSRAEAVPASAAVVQPAGSAEAEESYAARNAAVALGIALVVGLGLAFAAEAFDGRVRSESQLARIFGAPLLGWAPPDGDGADAYDALRVTLGFRGLGDAQRALLVTSAERGQGSDAAVVGLAAACARAGQMVTVVDLDLRDGRLAEAFGAGRSPGVTDVVLGDAEADAAIVPSAVHEGPLTVLPAGREVADPGGLAVSPALGALLRQVRARSGVVLVSAPPLTEGADALAASAQVDATVVVVRPGTLRAADLRRAAELLAPSPSRTLGVAVSGAREQAA